MGGYLPMEAVAKFGCLPFAAFVVVLFASEASARAEDSPTFADRTDEEIREADRRLNVLLNPLAMSIGVYGAEVDFVLGRYAAVGLEGALFRRGDDMGQTLGVGLLVYPFGEALQRLYFEPRVAWARPWGLSKIDWSADTLGLGATAGWQWTWDYGFSVRVGGGAMYFLAGQTDGLNGALRSGPQVVLDGSLGWAF